MPEEVTVEEVEQLHIDAWQLGLKAVAIYRDNCKVAQPLSMAKKGQKAGVLGEPAADDLVEAEVVGSPQVQVVERIVEKVVERVVTHPKRERMPRKRSSNTFDFRVADCKGFVHVGEYEDGRPGEVFINVSKQGSTLAGIMDAFAISVSHGLQYGVPLSAFVKMFTNMRFEPAGMTDDPDLRFASSIVDYIFRRLAIDYLPLEERMELGILAVKERMEPTLPGIEEATTASSTGYELGSSELPVKTQSIDLSPKPLPFDEAPVTPALERAFQVRPANADAPFCNTCGIQMQRAGSCHACPSCGSTSGCS
jgi:ribonucleoside-diphosphate reductase alpha chain